MCDVTSKYVYLVDLNMLHGNNSSILRKSLRCYLKGVGETNEIESGIYKITTDIPDLNEQLDIARRLS
jgi:hypothetical protein